MRWVSRPTVLEHKADAGGFSLAHFAKDERRKAAVERVYALGLDCDDGTVSLEAATEMLSRYRAVLYTTHSATPEAPRWRAVLALSRPVSAPEYDELWPHASWHFGEALVKLDHAARDPSRLWYLPAMKPDAEFLCRASDGPALDVDTMLRGVREHARNSPRRPYRLPSRTPQLESVRRYVAKMDAAIAGSGGHRAAFRVACFIASKVPSEADQTTLFAEYNQRCQPLWSERELAHKLADARKRVVRA